jgi:peptide subunit release factor RF-3
VGDRAAVARRDGVRGFEEELLRRRREFQILRVDRAEPSKNIVRGFQAFDRFLESHRGDIARDLDGDPVFLAPHEFGLNYEAERWKAIHFTAVKDYQVREAA